MYLVSYKDSTMWNAIAETEPIKETNTLHLVSVITCFLESIFIFSFGSLNKVHTRQV